MKNICFSMGDYTEKGGIERVTIELANEVMKRNKVFILTLSCINVLPLYKVNEDIDIINLKNTKSFHSRKGGISGLVFDIVYMLRNFIKIRKKIKEYNIDYITGTDIKLTFLLYLSTIGLSTKIVATEHFEYDVPSKVLKGLRFLFYRMLYKIVILTKEDLDKYKRIQSDYKKIEVIPNIIPYDNKIIRERIENKRIISVGRLTYQKGYDLLIEAWRLIEIDYPDWYLDIYGEGEDKEKLLDLINKYKLKNIILKGFSNDIKKEYLTSDFFVMSSRYEGLPTVLIEALSYSLPIISFACPSGPKTIIEDGVNGKLVQNQNIQDLKEKILLMINNKSLRDKYSENATKTIEQFSAKKVIEKWDNIFI